MNKYCTKCRAKLNPASKVCIACGEEVSEDRDLTLKFIEWI